MKTHCPASLRFCALLLALCAAWPAQAEIFSAMRSVRGEIAEKGRAEVRGLTASGIHSRWGQARRDMYDSACWVGSDFRICAR